MKNKKARPLICPKCGKEVRERIKILVATEATLTCPCGYEVYSPMPDMAAIHAATGEKQSALIRSETERCFPNGYGEWYVREAFE